MSAYAYILKSHHISMIMVSPHDIQHIQGRRPYIALRLGIMLGLAGLVPNWPSESLQVSSLSTSSVHYSPLSWQVIDSLLTLAPIQAVLSPGRPRYDSMAQQGTGAIGSLHACF